MPLLINKVNNLGTTEIQIDTKDVTIDGDVATVTLTNELIFILNREVLSNIKYFTSED